VNYRVLIASCSAVLLAIGCERAAVAPELSPAYRAAQQARERQDHAAAAMAYRQLLDEYPRFARGHLELGVLYDEKLGDPLEAIHHYRRYLAFEANAEKRRVVEEYVARAKLTLLGRQPSVAGAEATELVRLQTQNNLLLAEVAALKAKLVPEPATNVAPPSIPVTNVVAEVPKPRTHVVARGDTLYSLAARYYGNRAEWVKIYEANRAALPNKDQLRIDQMLVIP
jgi:nucleoid-associated protein YgaU